MREGSTRTNPCGWWGGRGCRRLVVATGNAREEEGASSPPFQQGGEDV